MKSWENALHFEGEYGWMMWNLLWQQNFHNKGEQNVKWIWEHLDIPTRDVGINIIDNFTRQMRTYGQRWGLKNFPRWVRSDALDHVLGTGAHGPQPIEKKSKWKSKHCLSMYSYK